MAGPVTIGRRRQLRELAEGGTPGPWRTTMSGYSIRAPREHDDAILASAPHGTYADEADASRWLANSELMAESKVAVPALLAALLTFGVRPHDDVCNGCDDPRRCWCGAVEHNAKVEAFLAVRR